MNIIENKIRQAHTNYKLSKDLFDSRRSKIEEQHEKYYELKQQRDNITLPLGKLRDLRNVSISIMNKALSQATQFTYSIPSSIQEVQRLDT